MLALNFQSPNHEKLLISRQKNCTVRLGDIRDSYPESSIVWITFGKKFSPKRKLFSAIVDKVCIKKFSQLNHDDLDHQNPEIKSIDELIIYFEKIEERSITLDDTVTVIYFSEILSDS